MLLFYSCSNNFPNLSFSVTAYLNLLLWEMKALEIGAAYPRRGSHLWCLFGSYLSVPIDRFRCEQLTNDFQSVLCCQLFDIIHEIFDVCRSSGDDISESFITQKAGIGRMFDPAVTHAGACEDRGDNR